MADYYSIIAKAVAALDPNTGEARRLIYQRARGALSGEARNAGLPLDKSDILAAQMSLEEAIARVETDALRAEGTRIVAGNGPVAPLAKNGRGSYGRGSWSRLFGQMFGGRNGTERTASVEPPIIEPPIIEPRIAQSRIAEPRATEPQIAEPRLPERRPAGPPPHPKGRDTWLTELLARASREEDEGEETMTRPPPKIRRVR
ncbi:MAG: hypothetical protein JO228_17055 [Xanthobacteraceae bacterium]|nr:hypothetical protein [Xanthobacteraceae bacterium]